MSLPLAGRVAVVTGASRGLGREVAIELSARGAVVVGVARSAAKLPGTARAIQADVSEPDAVAALAREVEVTLGPPSILVNAAGIFGPLEPLLASDPVRWIETLQVNAVGPYLTCRAFVPGMIELGWGRVVNVTSAASLHPPGPLGSAYATSKVALNQLTRHLAAEVEGTGITANVVHPGDVKTDMWADIRDQAASLGPIGEGHREWAEWVAETGGDPPEKAVARIVRLLEEESVNGRFLWIDGGLQAPLPSWDDAAEARPWQDP